MENRGRVPSLSLFGINQSTMHTGSQLVNWEFGIFNPLVISGWHYPYSVITFN